MSSPMLEDELRSYYREKADEIRVSKVDFNDFVRQGPRFRATGRQPAAPQRRYGVLAAACLVLVAAVAGAALVKVRSSAPSSSASPTTARPSVTTLGGGRPFTPINALLPTAMPAGYQADQVGVETSSASQRYTVWSSCRSCAEPTAAVALVRQGDDPGTTEQPTRSHHDVTIKGRTARFYPATATQPETSLISIDGKEPGFGFLGWGVDQAVLESLASGVVDGQDVPAATGLVMVFDGRGGGVAPGLGNADATVQIGYRNSTSGDTITYDYQHSPDHSDLNYLLFTLPFARFTTIDGHPAITSSYGGASSVVIKPDDNSFVAFTSTSAAVSISDLAAIKFDAASPSDPRWAAISAQSGTG
jgi:hypothetical protein